MDRVRLSVPDIRCEGCAESIRDALVNANGVERVDVDVSTQLVVAEYDAALTTPYELRRHVKSAGFDSDVI
jgi:copper chaperone CopZ